MLRNTNERRVLFHVYYFLLNLFFFFFPHERLTSPCRKTLGAEAALKCGLFSPVEITLNTRGLIKTVDPARARAKET